MVRGLIVVALAAAAAAVWFWLWWWLIPARSIDELSADLDRQLQACRRPWRRPALRAPGQQGNAAAEQARIVASMGELFDPQGERPDKAKSAAMIERESARLDELEKTADFDHAWTERPLEDGLSAPLAPLGRHRAAYRLLLWRAADRDPGECLRTVPRVMRLAQGAAPDTGILGPLILRLAFKDASKTFHFCSMRAKRADLERARDELLVLLRNPIPLGNALETELAMTMASLRQAHAWSSGAIESRIVAVAWSRLAEATAALKVVGMQDLPAPIEMAARQLDRFGWWSRVDAYLVWQVQKLFIEYVNGCAYSEAFLRAMIVATDGMLSGVRDIPPPSAATKELSDPFTGEPLRWELIKRCAAVWSIGENRVSDSELRGSGFHREGDDVFTWACFEPVEGAKPEL
jgi:hypothetical protein